MTTYNSDNIKKAEQVLSTNLGLARMVAKFAQGADSAAGFRDDLAASFPDLGSLLIAAARRDIIHFMQAHTALTEELRRQAGQKGEKLSYDSAVEAAYDILDEQGIITDERIVHFREQVIPRLARDLGVSLPEESARIFDFYEERARLRGKA